MWRPALRWNRDSVVADRGHQFIEYLEGLQLIADERTMNALGAFHLLPKGLAFVEGLPTAEQMLTAQAQAIARVSGASNAEK